MRSKTPFLVCIAVLTPLILLSFPKTAHPLKNASLYLGSPLIRLFAKVSGKSQDFRQKVFSPLDLVEQHKELKLEHSKLENYVVHLRELELENERLKGLLKFQESSTHKTLPAQVVGKDNDRFRRSLVLNKGQRQGVAVDMPVVTSFGLVGVITETGRSASKVMLITDPGFKVSAILQSTREEGIVRGLGKRNLSMSYVSKDANLRAQDVVLTSGLGGIFPKGLIIGGVSRVDASSKALFKTLQLKPSVRFSSLEEVLIILE